MKTRDKALRLIIDEFLPMVKYRKRTTRKAFPYLYNVVKLVMKKYLGYTITELDLLRTFRHMGYEINSDFPLDMLIDGKLSKDWHYSCIWVNVRAEAAKELRMAYYGLPANTSEKKQAKINALKNRLQQIAGDV